MWKYSLELLIYCDRYCVLDAIDLPNLFHDFPFFLPTLKPTCDQTKLLTPKTPQATKKFQI